MLPLFAWVRFTLSECSSKRICSAIFYLLVSSNMCYRTCAANKQKKKSTGFGFWGRLRSAVAVGENGRSVGSVSVSGSMATHGTKFVRPDPEDPLPPLLCLPRVLSACPIPALLAGPILCIYHNFTNFMRSLH